MARKRMIDPSIWTDEGMAELTPRQQLMYIGLFSNADDDGRLKASPTAIALMLPTIYSMSDRGTIEEDLTNVLAAMNQLVKYDVDGREYLAFKNYRQWQRIDKPSASILPPPPDKTPEPRPKMACEVSQPESDPEPFVDHSANDSGTVPPNRREEKGKEEKGKEDNARDERAASPYALLESLCDTLGQDVSVLSKRDKDRQLAVAKRLVEAGMTVGDVSQMTRWLISQSWVTGGVDFFLLEKQLGKWQLAGKPAAAASSKVSPFRNTPPNIATHDHDDEDVDWFGPYAPAKGATA